MYILLLIMDKIDSKIISINNINNNDFVGFEIKCEHTNIEILQENICICCEDYGIDIVDIQNMSNELQILIYTKLYDYYDIILNKKQFYENVILNVNTSRFQNIVNSLLYNNEIKNHILNTVKDYNSGDYFFQNLIQKYHFIVDDFFCNNNLINLLNELIKIFGYFDTNKFFIECINEFIIGNKLYEIKYDTGVTDESIIELMLHLNNCNIVFKIYNYNNGNYPHQIKIKINDYIFEDLL